MIGLRTNEADDLMARELESDDMLMAREYEDFLSRDYDDIFVREFDLE